MKIATWNINSVRARLDNVLSWLKTESPDVLLLQEIKCETDSFPTLDFDMAGYKSLILGQKSYNGVAILSKHPILNPQIGLGGIEDDPQARYLEATIDGVRIACLYAPNGNPVDSDKYPYKLRWMEALTRHARALYAQNIPVVLAGDYNVIPENEDVYDPAGWQNDALFLPTTRAAYRCLLNIGYTDAFRAAHPNQPHAYSFWDYQAGCWPQDKGLRIDHFLISPEAADRMTACQIDKSPRGAEKASDHTPVVLTLRPA
jgi:exodeoxyribonuclease III